MGSSALIVSLCITILLSLSCQATHHNCIHDELEHKSLTVKQSYPPIQTPSSSSPSAAAAASDHLQPMMVHHPGMEPNPHHPQPSLLEEEQQINNYYTHSYTTSSTSSSMKTLANTRPLRLILDTSMLQTGADKGLACYSVGEVININNQKYTCAASDILSSSSRSYLENVILPRTRNILTSALYTTPVTGNLILQNSYRCGYQGGVEVPVEFTTTGVPDADIVVFVTSRPITTPHVLAFGGECQEDQSGRAIAGHLNVSPGNINTDPYELDPQVGMLMHEVTHVLGFSFSKFQVFGGGSRRSAEVATSVATSDGSTKQVYKITTPRVVAWVRDHFNCSDLDGAELEDLGGDGTKLSHWEKRIFMNEYMTGQATKNPVFSGLTLALFEDSGWYAVNYTAAEHLVYGHLTGCQVPLQACSKWDISPGYFCKDKKAPAVSFDMQAKGYCDVDVRKPSPPPSSQYYGQAELGGPSELSDFCGYVTPDVNGWCTDDRNAALLKGNIIRDGETYCKACRAFVSSAMKGLPVGGDSRIMCYETACTGDGLMKVRVEGVWYDCAAGDRVSVAGFGGHIECPSAPVIRSLCAGDNIDWTWPVVTSVSPRVGRPGSPITIYGSGFSNATRVMIHDACLNTQVLSDGMIVTTVPHSLHFASPSHLVRSTVDIVVEGCDGKNGVGRGVFDVRVGVNMEWLGWFLVWMAHHWLPLVCMAGVGAGLVYLKHWYNKRRIANRGVSLIVN
eukprot:TRINITY_DN1672_c0_g1_i5.p1 TRINITY_DN1672_c0_g1~~TRINITY_DN1672_c0_g1_i5.p1  ORF type:complete len:735 (+),score=123.86 TRINITY_DN1672_c0_g1_i5:778-2982(+)